MHVLLDSSIYWTDPKRTKAGFKAITRLAVAGRIQLHLPHYVRKEFLTKQSAQLSRWFDEMKRAGTSILRTINHDETVDTVEQILDKVEVLSSSIMATATEEFDGWIDDTKTEIHEVDDSHGKRVTDAYFAGTDPFESPKKRDDFPDAFIYQAVQDLAEQHGRLYMIVADLNFRESCERLEKVTTHCSIENFIGLPECQALIRELDEAALNSNIVRARELLPQKTKVLQDELDDQIVNLVPDTTIWISDTPSETGEATVESIGTPSSTHLIFNEVAYYGDGRLVVPFLAVAECAISYFIYKPDWYGMDYEESKHISTTDWNKHYVLAEDYREIDVRGGLILDLPTNELQQDDLSKEDLSDLICNADYTVEVEDAGEEHSSFD